MYFEYITIALLIIACIGILLKRVHLYLHYFQQEEYMNKRYLRWIVNHTFFDRRLSLVFGGFIIALLGLDFSTNPYLYLIPVGLVIALAYWLVYTEIDPTSSPLVKKKLVLTNRVKRIRLVTNILFSGSIIKIGVISVLCWEGRACLIAFAALFILIVQLLPVYITIANYLLSFREKKVQAMFLNDAKQIIGRYKPYTVGITGSYGKTSTKMILQELMNQTLGPTFTPIRSINTLMGVTEFVRNNLKAFHKYAIIEMGAYNTGSIRRLAGLTPPNAAIVTRVGIMHLERYGSQDNIFLAKSELPQALPPDGVLVCNGDDPFCRKMAEKYQVKTRLLYGYDNSRGDLDAWIDNLSFTKAGSIFDIHFKGVKYQASCEVLGKPLLSNLLASFTMACALGADPVHVVSVIATLKSYDNRLQLVPRGEILELRDAYNSNPDGFAAALEVLGGLEGKRKILVTPGMVELGEKEYEENRRIAVKAAAVCDEIYIIGHTNRQAFVDGLTEAKYPADRIQLRDSMKETLEQLVKANQAGDIVLVENDLPDIYEKIFKP